jgi:hypothetical protein
VTRPSLFLLDADLLIAHVRRKSDADRWLPPTRLTLWPSRP